MANRLFCSFCGADIDGNHSPSCLQKDVTIQQVYNPLVGGGGSGNFIAKEERIVDPKTGAEKGMKLARFSLIPPGFVWALAEHYGKGAKKYADRNWEKGYKWSLSLDASQRHLNQWLMGEDNDEETGSSHLIAAAWHLCALWFFHKFGKGTNDVRVSNL